MDTKTADPYVVMEAKGEGYVRYRCTKTGRRWEVFGKCDRRGDCLIGAVVDTPDGEVHIKEHAHLERLVQTLGRERIDSELDVPVTPEFDSCCPFTYKELERGNQVIP